MRAAVSPVLGEELGPPFKRARGGPGGWIILAPDWVCEVLSPRTGKSHRVEKLPVYAREQVRHAWLVDPLLRTLGVLRLESARWVLLGVWSDEARVCADPFDAIELELGALRADVKLAGEIGRKRQTTICAMYPPPDLWSRNALDYCDGVVASSGAGPS